MILKSKSVLILYIKLVGMAVTAGVKYLSKYIDFLSVYYKNINSKGDFQRPTFNSLQVCIYSHFLSFGKRLKSKQYYLNIAWSKIMKDINIFINFVFFISNMLTEELFEKCDTYEYTKLNDMFGINVHEEIDQRQKKAESWKSKFTHTGISIQDEISNKSAITIGNESVNKLNECMSKPTDNFEVESVTKPFVFNEDIYVLKPAVAYTEELEHLTFSFFKKLKLIESESESKHTSHTTVIKNEMDAIKLSLKRNDVTDLKPNKDLKDDTQYEEKLHLTGRKSDSRDDNKTQFMEELIARVQIKTPIYEVYMTQVKSHPIAIRDIPWDCLNEERWRLLTFSQYPHSATKSAILLAAEGFAYCGSGRHNDDNVICYFCCATKQDWLASDIISHVHKRLSPDCSMVTGQNCNNVQMTAPEEGISLFTQLTRQLELNTVEATRQKTGNERDTHEIECDNAHCSHSAEYRNNLSSSPIESSRPAVPAQTPTSFQMANQPILPSSASNSSINQGAARATVIHCQSVDTNVPSNMMALTSSSLNSSSVIPNRPQTAVVQQENRGITSSAETTPASTTAGQTVQTLNGHQMTEPNATCSSTAASSQINQSSQSTSASLNRSSQNTSASLNRSSQNTSASVNQSSQNSSASVNQSNQNSSASVNQGSQNISASVALSTSNTSQITNLSQANLPQTTIGNTQNTIGNTQNTNGDTQNTNGDTQNTNRATEKGPTYGELGIITERPKRFEYAVRATRYASFEPWPPGHHLTKDDLADAGFYYAGYGDCARCFYCGGGLRNWDEDDDVWVEHARWFPKCAYIRQTKGQQFVNVVQELNKSFDKITFKMVIDRMGSSAASFHLDPKNMPLKRDPAVLTVLDLGYSEPEIIEAANYVKEKHGMLSADKVFERLEQTGKQRTNQVASTNSQSDKHTYDSKNDEVVMKKLKEENSQLRQQTACKICMDKEVAVVFLPCGHFVSCTDCAAAMKDCPVCRKQVRGVVRAFIG